MLSERSSRKKTFMPSCGRFHCTPAMARTRARTITNRTANAIHRRQAPIWTSDFTVNHTVQGTAANSSKSHSGWVNWKFIFCQWSVVRCRLSVGRCFRWVVRWVKYVSPGYRTTAALKIRAGPGDCFEIRVPVAADVRRRTFSEVSQEVSADSRPQL